MAEKKYQIKIEGKEYFYEEGTTLLQIAKEFQANCTDDIVLAIVDGKLSELYKEIKEDCTVSFVTTASPAGHKTYERSISFLMVKAIHDVTEHDKSIRVRILFSVDKGLYCTVEGLEKLEQVFLNQSFIDRVKARMHELVEEDLPIEKRVVSTDEAIELFHEHQMYEKEKLYHYRRASAVNIYKIGEFEDYYYGYMVPSTGYLRYFDLFLYDEGFVLQMPDKKKTDFVPEFCPKRKLFEVLKESTKWSDMQKIETVGQLNEQITKGDVAQLVLVQEALQEKKIAEIASRIAENKDIKFVLIAGPSSSGKTTFSHRLSIQLRANGMTPHPIEVDNYFVERDENPKDADGNYDFECIEAVDIDLFNRQMKQLLNGEEIVLPKFNFLTGQKEYGGKPKKLGKNDVLVIEGIHCLNPKMTEQLEDKNKFKIYISALTQLNIDDHNRIPTTDGRLLRRIIRDSRTRGASAKDTIKMWNSVRRGEEMNIFPFQEEADAMFNSALIYELAVLKPYVERELFAIERGCPEYIEANRILKFLEYFVGIGSENIPVNSLVREFIGGSCFTK